MFRTTVRLSFILAFGSLAACSSKSTDDKNTSAGNGAIIGGSASTGGSGGAPGTATAGTSPATAGTSTGTAGTSTGTAGTSTGTAGTASVGGSKCTDDTLTCLDATHVSSCNTATGAVETVDCIANGAAIGITSTGCVHSDLNGDGCDGTFADMACEAGADAFAYCNHNTQDEFLNIYINCFQDNSDGHTIIPCFSTYVTPAMKSDADCQMAEDACFGAGGAGP